MLPLASTATPSGLLRPLPSVVIAQLQCAVCASAEGANPPSTLRHRTTRARTHLPRRTQLVARGSLSECRSPGAATRLSLEITWEVAQDETHEGSRGDENSITKNHLMKNAFNKTRSNRMAVSPNASEAWKDAGNVPKAD